MRVWSDELSFRCVSTKGQSLQMDAQVRVDGTRVQYKYFLIKKINYSSAVRPICVIHQFSKAVHERTLGCLTQAATMNNVDSFYRCPV